MLPRFVSHLDFLKVVGRTVFGFHVPLSLVIATAQNEIGIFRALDLEKSKVCAFSCRYYLFKRKLMQLSIA